MTGIVIGLVVIAIVPFAFVLCPADQFSCQVTQSVSVVFGLMALVMVGVLLVDEWRNKGKAKNPERME